jgi:hypothetical protein
MSSDTSRDQPSAVLKATTRKALLILPGDEIADDRLAVRFGDVCLDVGFAELAEVVDD